MKPRVAFFGNCQLTEIHRILSDHQPFTERFEAVLPTPVYAMTRDELEDFAAALKTFHILVCQWTSPKYAPADNANIRALMSGQIIELPSIYFDGHLIDLTHHLDERGNVVGPTGHSSVILGSAFDAGFSREEAVAIYGNRRTACQEFLASNYDAGIAEMKRRESRCQISVSDYMEAHGSSARLFHTWNHPTIGMMLHVVDQITNLLNIPPVKREQLDHMSALRWPITGAVASMFGIEERDTRFVYDCRETRIEDFVDQQYGFYEQNPAVIEINRAALYPVWLRLPKARWWSFGRRF